MLVNQQIKILRLLWNYQDLFEELEKNYGFEINFNQFVSYLKIILRQIK